MLQIGNYINGQFVFTDQTIDDINPVDESVIAQIPRTQNVDAAVAAAKSALPAWKAL